uniref:Uncharacterized protein n=1 Tax=Arundo donax TaxID=35708 RepID=A0A0A9DNK0_ARUDO
MGHEKFFRGIGEQIVTLSPYWSSTKDMLPVTVRSRLATKARLSSSKAIKATRCHPTKVEVQPRRLGSPHLQITSYCRFTSSRRVNNLPASH